MTHRTPLAYIPMRSSYFQRHSTIASFTNAISCTAVTCGIRQGFTWCRTSRGLSATVAPAAVTEINERKVRLVCVHSPDGGGGWDSVSTDVAGIVQVLQSVVHSGRTGSSWTILYARSAQEQTAIRLTSTANWRWRFMVNSPTCLVS